MTKRVRNSPHRALEIARNANPRLRLSTDVRFWRNPYVALRSANPATNIRDTYRRFIRRMLQRNKQRSMRSSGLYRASPFETRPP